MFLKQRFDIIHLHLLSDQDSIFRIMNKNHLQLCDFSSENDLFLKNDSEQPISRSVYNELKDIDFVDDISNLLMYNTSLQYTTKEFVVKLLDTSLFRDFEELMRKYHCVIKEQSLLLENLFLLVNQSDSIETIEMANLFYESGLFEYSEPNFVLINIFSSNDTYYNNQWGLKNTGQYGGMPGIDIKVENAWNLTQGNRNVKVAIIDQGVERDHPDLFANIIEGYDASDNNSNGAPVWTTDIHGTACAGIIAAKSNNNTGITGVSPNSTIVPIHANDQSMLKIYGITNSFLWAVQNGSDIISCSWGGGSPTNEISNAISNALNFGRNGKGCVVVFSSGNNNLSSVNYPSSLDGVISVGAISPCGERKSPTSCDGENWGSNYGTKLSVVAPGVLVPTTDRQDNNGYNPNQPIHPSNGGNVVTQDYPNKNYTIWFNGTSAACPHVSGVAALMLSVNPNLTSAQVCDIIEMTAQKVRDISDTNGLYYYTNNPSIHPNGTWNEQVGYGLVDAHKAVVYALEYGYDIDVDGPSVLTDCINQTYRCDIASPELFTYQWNCSSNIAIISNEGAFVHIVPITTGTGFLTVKVFQQGRLMFTINKEITVSSLPFTISPISTSTFSITSDVAWSSAVYLTVETSVDSGATLTITDTLHCAPTARIIVRPGGRLVVDGGVLTSACEDGMWEGIYVEGDRTRPQTAANQGTVELKNGAVVENAHCGITTSSPDEQWLSTGGIVYASDAIFRNNRKSVGFLSYEDILPSGAVRTNLSSFSNCTFTVDNNNHFDNMQTEFDTHVSLWDVNNVKFYGCTFLNTATGPSAGKHAVYAEDAGFSVLPSCDMPENTYYGCVCPESHATYCSFGGFAKAVSAATSGTSFHVSIDQARFADNAVAVEISGNNFVSVTRCDFDLQSAPGNSLSTVGLSLDNCTGYLVEENFFHRSSMPMFYTACGITIRNSGGDNNQLYRNSFSKLDFATRVSGSNFRLISGLTCSCNTYENNRYDIYLDRESSMSPIQGGQSKGADNTFSFTGSSSLYNAGTQNIRYYHSHDRFMFPYAPSSSFTTYATAASNPCVSTLCNEGPQHPDYPRSPGGDFENLRTRYDSIADAAEDMMLFSDNSSHSDLDRSSYAGGMPSASAMASDTAVSELFLMSQRAVRFFLNDSASDIPAVRNWLSRTPGTPSHYALAEAEFQLGADNTAVLSDIASGRFDSQADRDEYDNFVAFDILKRTLTDHRGQHGTTMASVNWPSATPGQIAELQRIAEARTGRSSVMAQGVLCFFFDLCSDDFLESEQTTDTRSAEAPSVQPSGDGLVVSPNPTEGVLRVEGDGDISSVELYDTFGRLLLTRQCDGPLCILDIAGLNDGAYLLKVRFANGTVNSCKVVKK